MDGTTTRAVVRAIETMRSNFGESVTVDDLARAAVFSKFHFSRIFQQTTGISPGRFLSAVRLDEAKRLLVSSSLSVADISYLVGYNSIGTFSSRFRECVGVSPILYRRLNGVVSAVAVAPVCSEASAGEVRGRVLPPRDEHDAAVFVGLFPRPIMQGMPARHTVLPHAGRYALRDVPSGVWYLMSYSTGAEGRCVGWRGPIAIQREQAAKTVDTRLHRQRVIDPPALLALLDGDRTRPGRDRAVA